jgi:hypothetical protein
VREINMLKASKSSTKSLSKSSTKKLSKMKTVVIPASEVEIIPPLLVEEFSASFHPGRRLTMTRFHGMLRIHVREYERVGDREFPTRKGACFTPGRLKVLRGKISEIDEALRQQEVNASCNVTVGVGGNSSLLYKAHLGAGIYASIDENFNGVSLRRHWVPIGRQEIIPTKNGIYLPASQWAALKLKLDELLLARPDLDQAVECMLTHDNERGLLECSECAPFGWIV